MRSNLDETPCTVIATGSWMLAHGVTEVISSIATGSLANLGYGAVLAGAGWLSLECYDVLPWGIAEK